MANVIVFERNGEVRLATLIDEQKGVYRENLTNFVQCPKELLKKCVPSEIKKFCKKNAPQYLFLNSEGEWVSTTGPIPV